MRTRRSPTLILVLAAAGALLSARPAAADGCSIATTALAFGRYDVFAPGPTDSTAAVTYDCSGGGKKPIAIALVPSSGTRSPALVNGSERLYYNLFLNAGRTVAWGDGTGGTQLYVAERAKEPVTVPVFGRIPAGQDVAVGTYGDTVTVIVNF